MKLQIFAVYDSKAEAYLTPFFLHNIALAIRTFTDCVNDPDHPWGKHPEDYTLFHLGTFYDANAGIESHDVPESISRAWEIKPGLINLNDEAHRIMGDTPLMEVQ